MPRRRSRAQKRRRRRRTAAPPRLRRRRASEAPSQRARRPGTHARPRHRIGCSARPATMHSAGGGRKMHFVRRFVRPRAMPRKQTTRRAVQGSFAGRAPPASFCARVRSRRGAHPATQPGCAFRGSFARTRDGGARANDSRAAPAFRAARRRRAARLRRRGRQLARGGCHRHPAVAAARGGRCALLRRELALRAKQQLRCARAASAAAARAHRPRAPAPRRGRHRGCVRRCRRAAGKWPARLSDAHAAPSTLLTARRAPPRAGDAVQRPRLHF